MHAALAEELLAAYGAKPVPPLIERHPELTVDDAYAIQRAQVDRWLAGGAVLRGHKVGLSNASVRAQLGVDQPDYGHLLDTMFYEQDKPIPVGHFLQPRLEPEIAFVLGEPLRGPGVTPDRALAAVDHLLPALELVDSRIADWRISIVDTIADNASSGAVVLGTTPVPVGAVDLVGARCVFTRNGTEFATGVSSAVMDNPVNSVAWLANVLGERGITLEAGQVILPGSITPVAPVEAGDTFESTVDGLGTVTATFTGEGR
ncbi:2-keto-4-pentenoate hydratase [Amycolatopsis suaedae]|uniref:2-keto-4-pentenoate hydratase n=1 Tax=Amycolatopsis suaedae TaxID=2510978 RepID=A0A4Q7JA25_9PSEU|nr:2-keto-4-pentenoate hydratase [Amycolatopsis suaedae]RZQ63762.1 2-keto-4-pentenoate hydratase [Amycolatopsis suaedae]